MQEKNRKYGFKRVLLITPSYEDSAYRSGDTPEPGTGYIAEFLSQNRIEYDVMDMSLGYSFDDLKKKIRAFKPDLIGFGFKSFQYKTGYNLIRRVREFYPEAETVLGGPHISVFREKALEDCKEIDFGIIKEGEYTILELCKGKKLSDIKGLMYRDGKKIIYNGDRERITDLDSLPFPKYEKFELGKYWYPVRYIVTSRGCPAQCIYCSIRLVIGNQWFGRSPENIFEEVKYWHDRGQRHFEFTDDNFTLVRKRVDRLLDLFLESGMNDLILNCPNGVRADVVDRELMTKMKRAGFNQISFGAEVGNDRMLRYIKKGTKLEIIERAIRDAIEVGLEVHLFFIIGFPTQTEKDVEDAFNLALKYPVRLVNFYNLIPYPGTELFEIAKEKNYLLAEPECYLGSVNTRIQEPLLATPELSYKQRKRLLAKGKKISDEVTKRYHLRKLKQYGLPGQIIAFLYRYNIIPGPVFRAMLKLR